MTESASPTDSRVQPKEAFNSYFSHAALRVSRVLGVLTVALGLTVLLGWAFDIKRLETVLPGYVSMKANTALCFMLCGGSLFTGFLSRPRAWKRKFSQVLAALVILI